MQTITLENEALRLVFSADNGALVGLLARGTNWAIITRPSLGLSFRLLLPLPDRRNNPVYGEKQTVSRIEQAPDSVTFIWNSVNSEYGGNHDLKVTLNINLSTQQAIYRLSIENNTDLTVENVYCPYFGEVRRPDGEAWFKAFWYTYATAQEWSLWPTYQNSRGYYGIDFPTQFAPDSHSTGAPMAPFVLLRGEKQGLYVGVAAPETELVSWHTELRPGYDNSISARIPSGLHQLHGRVPDDDTLSGKDVAVRFGAVHVPYILPGETRTLTPIAIAPYQGE